MKMIMMCLVLVGTAGRAVADEPAAAPPQEAAVAPAPEAAPGEEATGLSKRTMLRMGLLTGAGVAAVVVLLAPMAFVSAAAMGMVWNTTNTIPEAQPIAMMAIGMGGLMAVMGVLELVVGGGMLTALVIGAVLTFVL
mgnify:CR=1 FL=1